MEIKIADAIFLKIKKNMFLIKDLSNPKIHYSAFMIGSNFDLHITAENESDPKKKHTQLVRLQVDWEFLLENLVNDIKNNLNSIFQHVKTSDPVWQDMEIKYISTENLEKILQIVFGRKRWNVDETFFDKFSEALQDTKFKELTDKGITLGLSSEGFLVLSDGTDCFILNIDKLLTTGNKYLELAIRKFDLKYYTLGTVTWWIKIKLLNLRRNVINHLMRIIHISK